MSKIIDIPTHSDERGSLSVIEKFLPFDIKRVYYIYNVPPNVQRGAHAHKKTIQAFVCLQGTCTFMIDNGATKKEIILNNLQQCLILNPEDWHTLSFKTQDSILLVLASELYNKEDYIYERPKAN